MSHPHRVRSDAVAEILKDLGKPPAVLRRGEAQKRFQFRS
jgi:hypothetical protein